MDESVKSNLLSQKTWLRLPFILLFIILLNLALTLTWVLVPLQFIFTLFSGSRNSGLHRFADMTCQYMHQVLTFLCYVSDEKPFPFSDFPEYSESNTEGDDLKT